MLVVGCKAIECLRVGASLQPPCCSWAGLPAFGHCHDNLCDDSMKVKLFMAGFAPGKSLVSDSSQLGKQDNTDLCM